MVDSPLFAIGMIALVYLAGVACGYILRGRNRHALKDFGKIVDSFASVPLQGFDARGNIFIWNRASELIYGYGREYACGKNIAELLLGESERGAFVATVSEICKTKKPAGPRQWTVLSRAGNKQVMYSLMFPYLRSGRCAGVFCVDIDITEIKSVEQELQASRELYQGIFDGMNEAVVLIDPHTGILLDANEKMSGLFGYAKQELLQLTLESLSYGDRKEVERRTRELIAKAFFEGAQIAEWAARTKDGRLFPLELNLQKAEIAGRPCVLAVARDVTRLRKAEEGMRRAEQRYADFLENTQDIVFALNYDGTIRTLSPAVHAIMGMLPQEAVGQRFADFFAPADRQQTEEIIGRVIQGEKQEHREMICRRQAGQEVFFLLNAWPDIDVDGTLCGVHGVMHDITAQKQTVERMREMVVQVIGMLSETVSVADRYTEEHCQRLQQLSLKIGARLNLKEQQLQNLKYAALLHDVGKVGVPVHILIKKGPLNSEEWQQIREHPKKGADIVRQLAGFNDVAEIIEQHQERVDGKGYPRGLTQEQIRREAAIISVVDAFDAMISDRPYRKAMTVPEAIEELKRNSGTQFDPEVVKVFVDLLNASDVFSPENA